MTIARLAELTLLAQECFDKAEDAAKAIRLSHFSECLNYGKSIGAHLLADDPRYSQVEPFRGMKAWGAILSFDLRKSSERALRVGPRDTYITMHTYMPTMIKLVGMAGGIIVGLRGDGAIGCFGLVDLSERSRAVIPDEAGKAVSGACDCGDAMVKTVEAVVNTVLEKGRVEAGLRIGVGIDVGEIVATNIGLGSAHELTAYGNCVNKACKWSFGTNQVILTNAARRMFPKRRGGRTEFHRHPLKKDCYILRYPPDYKTVS